MAAARPLHVIVLASMTAHTGNSVTAARYKAHAEALGATCDVVAAQEGGEALKACVAAAAGRAVTVLGIHAFRAGSLMLDLPDSVDCVTVLSGETLPCQGVPPGDRVRPGHAARVFKAAAGTDMNHYASDPDRAALMGRVLDRSRAVVAMSQPMADACAAMLASLGKPPMVVEVIPQAVLLEPEASGPAGPGLTGALSVPPDSRVVLLPSGIRRVKRPAALILPLQRAAEVGGFALDAPLVLALVGPVLDAELAAEVDGCIASLGPGTEAPGPVAAAGGRGTAFVCCRVGAVERATLLSWMRDAACAAVANCSSAEGHPNAVVEAMARGCPVVVSGASGNRETVRHMVSGFVEESDDAMATRLAELARSGPPEGMLCAAWTDTAEGGRFSTSAERAAWGRVLLLPGTDTGASEGAGHVLAPGGQLDAMA